MAAIDKLQSGLKSIGIATGLRDPRSFAPEQEKLTPQQNCEAMGGTWTMPNGPCVFTKTEPTPEEEAPKITKLTPEERLRADKERGTNIITDAQGNERLQTRQDVEFAEAGGDPETGMFRGGAAEALEQKQAQQAEQQRLQQLASTIGTIGGLQTAQEADINFSQALTAGTIGSLPSILASVGAGITGGAISGAVGGPVGVVGGAIIGAIAGVARGIMGNIKEQQKGELQAADIELTNARTNMRQLAMLASQDPQNADVYIAQYNAQLTRVHQARRQTKAEVSGDLNSWIEDGREQLADFDAFLQPGGIADIYGQKLQVSLLTGAPIDMSGMEFLP